MVHGIFPCCTKEVDTGLAGRPGLLCGGKPAVRARDGGAMVLAGFGECGVGFDGVLGYVEAWGDTKGGAA